MYTSLLRDEPVVPVIRELLGGFHRYRADVVDVLLAGRRLRGGAARRTRAALGHALAFPTWRSLVREQQLPDRDAVELMCRLVEDAARPR